MSKDMISQLKFKKPAGFDHNEFAKKLEAAYLSTNRDGKNTKKSTFSPSTVGYGHGNCPRYWFIAFNGADFDEEKSGQAIANMMNGTYSHDRIQKMMGLMGVPLETEVEIKLQDPPIRGFVDAVVEWDGKRVVGEIKTAKDEVFVIKQASNKPSGNHMIQVLLYMHVLKINEGFVMYENKNTQEICIIPVSMNDNNREYIDGVLDWMRSVYKSYTDDILPVRSGTKSSSQCKYCPVKKQCWKEMEEGEAELSALSVRK